MIGGVFLGAASVLGVALQALEYAGVPFEGVGALLAESSAVWLPLAAFALGLMVGHAIRKNRAEREASDFGDLPRFSALERDCMQLLCEMEDGAAHRVEERETRRGYAAERLAEDGYLDLCGYGSGWADYRLSRDARRVLSARAREWGRAKRGAGIPDGSIFAPENDLPPAGSDFDLDAAVARLTRIG